MCKPLCLDYCRQAELCISLYFLALVVSSMFASGEKEANVVYSCTCVNVCVCAYVCVYLYANWLHAIYSFLNQSDKASALYAYCCLLMRLGMLLARIYPPGVAFAVLQYTNCVREYIMTHLYVHLPGCTCACAA